MESLKQQEKSIDKHGNERVLGKFTSGQPGATIICFCSIHGNEPAGKTAFDKVLKDLNKLAPDFNGKVIGLHGNITASTENERFIDYDLNRIWTEDRVRKLEKDFNSFPEEYVEDVEQKYLWKLIHHEIKKSKGQVVFIDLHTTSSESQPFISINDTLRNRMFAMRYPLPIVLGLEEYLEGTILSYINELGHIAIGVEAGQHTAESSVENHESFIWSTLFFAGCLDINKIHGVNYHYMRLAKDMIDGSKIYEVRHRHPVTKSQAFLMKPGYVNFQRIRKNEVLAMANEQPVKAPESGQIFMPLYQKLGNDGFFVVRRIRKFWLEVSAFLRRREFHRFIQFLPGVGKYRDLDHSIVVNRKIARWFVIDLFHLLGFRRKLQKGNKIVFIRRPVDI